MVLHVVFVSNVVENDLSVLGDDSYPVLHGGKAFVILAARQRYRKQLRFLGKLHYRCFPHAVVDRAERKGKGSYYRHKRNYQRT